MLVGRCHYRNVLCDSNYAQNMRKILSHERGTLWDKLVVAGKSHCFITLPLVRGLLINI